MAIGIRLKILFAKPAHYDGVRLFTKNINQIPCVLMPSVNQAGAIEAKIANQKE